MNVDTVSYNTWINCWKESGLPGTAQWVPYILRLMKNVTMAIVPNTITYEMRIRAWTYRTAKDLLWRRGQGGGLGKGHEATV